MEKKVKVTERQFEVVKEVTKECTDSEIEDLFGDDPGCLVMALLKRAQLAETQLEQLETKMSRSLLIDTESIPEKIHSLFPSGPNIYDPLTGDKDFYSLANSSSFNLFRDSDKYIYSQIENILSMNVTEYNRLFIMLNEDTLERLIGDEELSKKISNLVSLEALRDKKELTIDSRLIYGDIRIFLFVRDDISGEEYASRIILPPLIEGKYIKVHEDSPEDIFDHLRTVFDNRTLK